MKSHMIGAIRWALGLVDADVTPGNVKADPKEQVEKFAVSTAPGGGRAAGGGRGGQ